MIIYHSYGLHEGIAYCRPDEAKAVFFKPFAHVLTHRYGFIVVRLGEFSITNVAPQVCT